MLVKNPIHNTPKGVFRKGDAVAVELLSRHSHSQKEVRAEPRPVQVAKRSEIKKKASKKKIQRARKKKISQLGFKKGTQLHGQLGRPDGFEANAKERYLYELRVLIENRKVYPAIAKRLRETGRVVVEFEILKDGHIQGVRLARPSHFDHLNNAAIQLIASIEKYRPLPKSIPGEKLSLKIPVEYVLQ